ncbi:hypothetical protein CORC01_12097 [Colletotrichum orchidophilum]|uniref:Uncharacterized protein n=1 Tax=Colletotrichum orchidophilum TaxID=1209926 RepID=A0A1G4AU09_9PEZI|nr:uncharacterized protein CORC01_12097 [Colletotrichum orchidophilum]OHE92586.1 hypothetical protein CORC01_12097 [Colletotrichum orchidophilum]
MPSVREEGRSSPSSDFQGLQCMPVDKGARAPRSSKVSDSGSGEPMPLIVGTAC